MPPSGAGHYRTKAAECEQKAKKARDPEVKRDFFELARQWREVAEQIERDGMDLDWRRSWRPHSSSAFGRARLFSAADEVAATASAARRCEAMASLSKLTALLG
jgi:hypothetical protein